MGEQERGGEREIENGRMRDWGRKGRERERHIEKSNEERIVLSCKN